MYNVVGGSRHKIDSVVSLYELKYYKHEGFYKCAVPATSFAEAIEKLIKQSPEVTEESIFSVNCLSK